MKIAVISDTHCYHEQVHTGDIDMLIHAGDSTDEQLAIFNQHEFYKFWDWWIAHPAKYKIYVAGNHDSYLESPMSNYFLKTQIPKNCVVITKGTNFEMAGIKFYASPFTPEYGSWSFMYKRAKGYKHWNEIEEDREIVITHGPPYSILDLTEDRDRNLKFCGCKNLLARIQKVKPKYHIFGHIHGNKKFRNNGILERDGIKFINASMVKDNMFNYGILEKPIIINYGN